MDADAIVLERLRYLRGEVDYLKIERDSVRSFRQYAEDVRLKKAVERSLQVAIEACLDIGRHSIALGGFRYPEDNKDVFKVLQEEGVIPTDLLPALVDMVRFRNLIVHDYARIDDAKVYAILGKRSNSWGPVGPPGIPRTVIALHQPQWQVADRFRSVENASEAILGFRFASKAPF